MTPVPKPFIFELTTIWHLIRQYKCNTNYFCVDKHSKTKEKLADIIILLRKEAGVTHLELADKIKFSLNTSVERPKKFSPGQYS